MRRGQLRWWHVLFAVLVGIVAVVAIQSPSVQARWQLGVTDRTAAVTAAYARGVVERG